MCYRYYSGGMITGYGDCILAKSFITGKNVIRENDLPCWSLAALLGVLPDYTLQTTTDKKVFVTSDSKKPMMSDTYDNPVDACVDMIIKLNELNLL